MKKLVIYNDRRKMAAITASYVLIAACVVALGLTQHSNAVLLALCIGLAVLICAGVAHNVREMLADRVLFEFTEQGVTDYTKPDDVISLPWSQVVGVQVKAANTNDLMLDVMGYRTADQLDEVTPEMRLQLEQSGGDRVYYALELSGLWVRRSTIRDAFDWIREHTQGRYPQIAFQEYKDPLSKLGTGRKTAGPAKEAA